MSLEYLEDGSDVIKAKCIVTQQGCELIKSDVIKAMRIVTQQLIKFPYRILHLNFSFFFFFF